MAMKLEKVLQLSNLQQWSYPMVEKLTVGKEKLFKACTVEQERLLVRITEHWDYLSSQKFVSNHIQDIHVNEWQ